MLFRSELDLGIPAREIVVSWNADAPADTGLRVEAKAIYDDHATRWYTLARWSKEGNPLPRESVKGQKDSDGDVQTDTLALVQPASKLLLRITLLTSRPDVSPTLKFLGVSALDDKVQPPELSPNRTVWGKEIVVPGRSQLGWPGGSGWCSPTSTNMAMAFWAIKLKRPELDMSVPDTALAINDPVYNGTGNWPFNTAFAGSFPGMRAYVTRLSDVRELEDWIEVGIPPIVSVSYDLLRGRPKAADPGHLLVCDGFTPTGDLVLNDPCFHPEKGEVSRITFSRANFVRAWKHSQNTVYLIYPEGAKRPTDPYGHWED